ncbi:hypothetical protein DL766_008934 [Monosporascus sp. MC13-8B]|uniref:N-acetyltransferase domain-containing protein n=1 Tax=Monosporascus cannonballus TaxID=155416 RepID=A0ABY0GZ22_9PEZI|nr:hypothetical protein DL762_008817 [Monosporascus cannonballus]RYO78766.1 hypothetical protein DL763_009521 [Monosporascus cannonballus]RYP17271.1 hypothetical protein DL766_008934 [Monosporascus sp. MC13-8B]
MVETSNSSAAGGSPQVTYSFATRGDVFELSTTQLAATWDTDYNKSFYYDDIDLEDEDVKREAGWILRYEIEALFHRGDRSRILKAVRNGEIVGLVMVEEMSKKEIEDTKLKGAAPERRRSKPTHGTSDEKYDLYGERFDEWAHDLSVAWGDWNIMLDALKSHMASAPFFYVSGLGVKPEWQKQNVGTTLFAKVKDYAEDCNMGLLFLVDKNEKQFYERGGATFAEEEVKGKKTTYLVSWTSAGGAA